MDIKERYLIAKRALFDKVFGARLNPEQCKAVFCAHGPLLVLAGAGSGKTTVLVNRISYLIKYGNAYHDESVPEWISEEAVGALEQAASLSAGELEDVLLQFITEPTPPWSVLAITFTNKAAGEIRERLSRSFEDESIASSIWAGTFHSVCMRILRKFGDRVGLREGFSIYDTDDKKRMIADCMKDLNIDEKSLAPRAVADMISREKDNLRSPDEMDITQDPRSRKVVEIYRYYEKKMREHNAVDFDDIIKKTVELLRSDVEVRDYYQRKFRYVLVDEYQDTNPAQFVLTSLLSDGHRNIMVVGDDDQSIYKFRGATIENILNFDKTYPDATVIKLEQNYRSTSTILDAANGVISRNFDRHQKSLWSAKGTGDRITLHTAENADEEGRYILDKISRAVKTEGKKYSDFAVLMRINALTRSYEQEFTADGIPYKVFGGFKFFERKEIKDLLAYLRLINNPFDSEAATRIINFPKRGIGAKTVETLQNYAFQTESSVYDALIDIDELGFNGGTKQKLVEFRNAVKGWIIDSQDMPVNELVKKIVLDTKMREAYADDSDDSINKRANIEESSVYAASCFSKACS